MSAQGRQSPTPGQTVGPFFGYALPYDGGNELVPPTRPDAIRLHGRVYDGAGDPVPDALIEVWQAAPDGSVPQAAGSLHRDGYTFTGWGRAATDRTGHYQFSTLRPGGATPYFAITVFARGLLDRLFTRAYLPGSAPAQWPSLAAAADDRGFVFDIRLQGEGETVFLSYTQD
ncbi:protocatechuate 3,4-dioxygenase subunit alpha [Nocardioides endophyticus]|uniref:Protocatechuate 3,4-dioxygenase subunit alpha n=1 Tax=Nocardioides endophyticus TaxID=1353775 RepID=A0ABP8Y800_9ACTN